MNAAIAQQRLANQRITRPAHRAAADVVQWLGAVQAQEYPAAAWGLALRMAGRPTAADIDRAFDAGEILRTHLMRPTWHFVAAADIKWLLALTAARVHRAMAFGYRQNELDDALRLRATKVFERALRDGGSLTRAELAAHLDRAGLAMKGVRLALTTIHAELEGVICSGARRDRRFTYTLLAERARRATSLSRDEALAELTTRYFRSHGPATIRDFVWWSGLPATDAKRGLEAGRARRETIDGLDYWTIGAAGSGRARGTRVDLLPIYDEYLVAYRDLDAVPRGLGQKGRLEQAIVVDGQVAGTWRVVRSADGAELELAARRALTERERQALAATASRYARFLGVPLAIRRR